MKVHTTNYFNTFIEIAEDSPVSAAAAPPLKLKRTIPEMQYEMISKNPYKFTSDDIIFECYVQRHPVPENEKEEVRKQFFSKGQACLRSSQLAKRYGYGIHSDKDGKIALFSVESEEYKNFVEDNSVKKNKSNAKQKSINRFCQSFKLIDLS